MTWTIMRHALYQDLLLLSLPQAIASGYLATATNDKGRHLVTRDDCARADAAVLAPTDRANRIYEITGPAAVTASEIASIASEISGRPVKHLAIDKAELMDGMLKAGLPASVAGMMARFDEAAALGFYGTVTNFVYDLTGYQPTSVRDFLSARRAELTG